MQKFEYRCSLAECTVSLGAIVRSEAKISTVSFRELFRTQKALEQTTVSNA